MILTLAPTPTLTQPVTAEVEGAPKAKAPQETKTYCICPNGAAHGKLVWRGMCPKRHRERCPECQYEPFGVSYKTAALEARVEAAEREADEQGMDEGERSGEVKRARNTFFFELAKKAYADWRAGRGRAMALKQDVDGARLVRVVVPPHVQPRDHFAHRGVKGLPIKRTPDGHYVESKEEDVWEQGPGAWSDEATPACPIGPVPYPLPADMIITVWAREQRPSEAVEAAAKAAEAAAKAAEAAAEAAAWDEEEALAFGDDDDDDADNEPDDAEEEGEAEEDEAAPAAAAPADAVAAPAAEPTDAPAAPIAAAAPAAAPVAVAADANARIEAAVAAAVAQATQTGMSAAAAQRKARCSRALTSEPHTPTPPPNPKS